MTRYRWHGTWAVPTAIIAPGPLAAARDSVVYDSVFTDVAGACTLARYTGVNTAAGILAGYELRLTDRNDDEVNDTAADSHNNNLGVSAALNSELHATSCEQIADDAIANGAAAIFPDG